MIVDGVEKAAFAVRQALSSRALADAVPDVHAKRIVARGVFVAVASFIDVARQTRNQVPVSKANRTALAELKQRINAFAQRDWGPYEEVRHRIAAHRQPIGGNDDVSGWENANERWAEIDAVLVAVLCDDMTEIYGDLLPITGGPQVHAPIIMPSVAAAIGNSEFFSDTPDAVTVDVGSFGRTRELRVSAIQGGDVGERLRHLADTLDAFETHDRLLQHVIGQPQFERAVRTALVIETCNFVDLTLTVPPSRRPEDTYRPLVDLLDTSRPDFEELDSARARLDRADVAWVRGIRDTVAAHIDGAVHLRDLIELIDGCDLQRLYKVWSYVDAALVAAMGHGGSVLTPLKMRGRTLSGFARGVPRVIPPSYDGDR